MCFFQGFIQHLVTEFDQLPSHYIDDDADDDVKSQRTDAREQAFKKTFQIGHGQVRSIDLLNIFDLYGIRSRTKDICQTVSLPYAPITFLIAASRSSYSSKTGSSG